MIFGFACVFPNSLVEVVKKYFGNYFYGPYRNCHDQLTGHKIGDHNGVNSSNDSPGNRLKETLEVRILSFFGDEKSFERLV